MVIDIIHTHTHTPIKEHLMTYLGLTALGLLCWLWEPRAKCPSAHWCTLTLFGVLVLLHGKQEDLLNCQGQAGLPPHANPSSICCPQNHLFWVESGQCHHCTHDGPCLTAVRRLAMLECFPFAEHLGIWSYTVWCRLFGHSTSLNFVRTKHSFWFCTEVTSLGKDGWQFLVNC